MSTDAYGFPIQRDFRPGADPRFQLGWNRHVYSAPLNDRIMSWSVVPKNGAALTAAAGDAILFSALVPPLATGARIRVEVVGALAAADQLGLYILNDPLSLSGSSLTAIPAGNAASGITTMIACVRNRTTTDTVYETPGGTGGNTGVTLVDWAKSNRIGVVYTFGTGSVLNNITFEVWSPRRQS